MQTIGRMSLYNGGWFVARIKFDWFDPDTGSLWVSDAGSDIAIWFSKTLDPGSVGVPDGSVVILHVDVVAGQDNIADQVFLYQSGATETAQYSIRGTVSQNTLEFDTVG